MKRILITGAGSYIGTSFEKWISQPQFAQMYEVDTVDMRGDVWRAKDFSGYDTVFHVAGIAHADTGKVTGERKKLYYKVNCDLAIETAEKAKKYGVKQFIYMSSIIVYGEGISLKEKKVITKETEPKPSSFYGDSKWKAEQKLMPLTDARFHVVILRPPMIYGEGCKGNFNKLCKLCLTLPIFPRIVNKRSVLYIKNLCEYIRLSTETKLSGIFYPANKETLQTCELIYIITKINKRKVCFINILNPIICFWSGLPFKTSIQINKLFGSLYYENSITINNEIGNYHLYDLKSSIQDIYEKKIKLCCITTVNKVFDWFFIESLHFLHSNNFTITMCSKMNEEFIYRNKEFANCISLDINRGICPFKMLKTTVKLILLFKRNNYDMIQYCSPNAAFCASIAGFFSRIPIRIYSQWGIRYVTLLGFEKKIFKILERITCNLSTVIQPDSFENRQFAVEEKLYPIEKSQIIWNGSACGVNLSKFDIKQKKIWKKDIRAQYKIDLESFVLIYVGRVTFDKGIEELLKALKKTRSLYKDVYLLMIGDLEEVGTLNTNLYTWSRGDEHIQYVGPQNNVANYIAASDVLILPSHREGFGLVTIESQALGVPVIVSDIPGPTEAMINGKTGFTFTMGNSESLFRKIEILYLNRELCKIMGRNGYNFAKENFSQNKFLEELLENRKSLIKERLLYNV